MKNDLKYGRIIILGAGFSVNAGLPLGAELSKALINHIQKDHDEDSPLSIDLQRYLNYRRRADDIELIPEQVDVEDFLSYLDIEHFLGLKGSDTWSREGNKGQILVKRFIGKYIHERTPLAGSLPQMYLDFADQLQPGDFVLTFNYDVLLERCLDQLGKSYRLFPTRYSSVGEDSGTVDTSMEEITILKMHGSVDWFEKTSFNSMQESFIRQGHEDMIPTHAVFADETKYKPRPIVDGPRYPDDPLIDLYRITDPDFFYCHPDPPETPWILSPSRSKILYSPIVHAFWYGIGQSGGWNLGMAIIGFSLPNHDEYLRQALYLLLRNYQEMYWDEDFFGKNKCRLKVVDYLEDDVAKQAFKHRYNFVDWDKTELIEGGFNEGTADAVFRIDH